MKKLPKTIHLKITARDLSLGRRGEATSCPAALALKRRKLGRVSVGAGIAWVRRGKTGLDRYTSMPLQMFVRSFDDGVPLVPTTLALFRG